MSNFLKLVLPTTSEPRYITRYALMNRFTTQELVTIELAGSADRPSFVTAEMAAQLRIFNTMLNAATFVDLDEPRLAGAIEMLEAAGLLNVGRAVEILSAEIQPQERP